MTGHTVFLAGILLASAGACSTPTNIQKLVCLTIGFVLAAAGAHDALHGWRWTWTQIPLLAFLGAGILTTLIVKVRKPLIVLPSVTRSDGLFTQALYVGLALFASQLVSPDREIVIEGLLLGALWVTVVAYWQSFGKAQWALPAGATSAMMDTRVRSCGTLANPLFLGGYTALLLPIAAWRAAHAGATGDYIVAGALAFTALLSGSRAAWAGLLVAVPVSLWGAPPHWPETAGGLVTILLVAGVGRREHLSRAGWKDVLHDTVQSVATFGRGYICGECLKQIKQKPIFGHGWSQLAIKNPDPAASDFFDKSHCDFLDTFHAVGAVGLVCYLGIWTAAFATAGPFLAAFVGYFIWSLGGWQHLGPSNIFYPLVGLAIAGAR